MTSIALLGLLLPLASGGVWDPVELHVAEMASRIARILFHAKQLDAVSGTAVIMPTLGELGRGELPFTSVAVGFRLFGLHDWAGRVPLAFWILVALIGVVAWTDHYVNRRAAVWTALVFSTMPIVFFQARFMLGDATTIGTLTASFVCLCFACFRTPASDHLPIGRRLFWLGSGVTLSVMGVLSRGIILGMAVPFVAVGLAGLLSIRRCPGGLREVEIERAFAIVVFALGVFAAGCGIWIALSSVPLRGLRLILQGTTLQHGNRLITFDAVVSQLGHGLFPWSGVLPFAIASVFTHMERGKTHCAERRAVVALIFVAFLAAASQSWLMSLGVTLPFPAVAALAAFIGIWLDSLDGNGMIPRTAAIGIVAVLVLFLADFENTPDKILAAIASTDAHIPVSFRKENSQWLQGCCIVIFGSLAAFGINFGGPANSIWSNNELRKLIRRVRMAWGGQLMFFVLLVETALLTGAVLLFATRFGFPFRRLKELGSPQRDMLTWAWLAMPLLALVTIGARAARDALRLFFSRGFGLPSIALSNGFVGQVTSRILLRYPRLDSFVFPRSTVCAACFVLAASFLSLGWATRLSEQLSPRRALNRFENLAKPGEPLGLLGIRPQITQYYSKQRPEVLLDAEESADWLLYGKGSTRWMIVKGDQFSRLNAAYRERCQCFRNLPVVDGRSSDMLLVSNRRLDGITNDNPLDGILLEHPPRPQQSQNADFGGQIEALGWELLTERGHPIAELTVGRKYELRLYYRVLTRPTLDWETFVHIDGYGRRYNGDHETTQGRYPMSNWRAGDLVMDSQTILLDPSFSHGNYELYYGFYKGGRRLEVRRGHHDENRLLAGTIRVR
jgi:hypothetical protein